MNDDVKFLIKLFTPILLASREGALASPEGCEHRLRVGLNDNQYVCCACRTVIDGPCSFGVAIIGSPESSPEVNP